MLQEFDIEIRDKPGVANVAADHLSRPESSLGKHNGEEIRETFPEEVLAYIDRIEREEAPWFADFANYLHMGIMPSSLTKQKKKKFFSDLKYYYWDAPYLFRRGPDNIIRRCVPESETRSILDACHSGEVGGHYGPQVTARKVLDAGFNWPTLFREAVTTVKACDSC